MAFFPRALAITLALATIAAAPAQDPLRDRLIADAKMLAPPTMTFDRATSAVQSATSGESKTDRRTDRWTGTGWTLQSVNGKPPTASETADYLKQTKDQIIPGYYRIGLFLSGATSKATDAQGRTVYHIPTMPKGSVVIAGDVSDKMAGDVTIDTSGGAPFASHLHIYANAPFRIMLVAKIDRFDTATDYARGTEGKPVVTRSLNTITGSQFGKEGTQRIEAVYSNVRHQG
jgi:hypothetical protein